MFEYLLGAKRRVEEASLPSIRPPASEAESYDEFGIPSGPQSRDMAPDWYELGRHPQVTHLVIKRDQVNSVDYPYFSAAGDSIEAEIAHINGENACDVLAVFNYREPIEAQLARKTPLNF